MISVASLEAARAWGQEFLEVNKGVEAEDIGWRDLFIHVLGLDEEVFDWIKGHLRACLDNGWSEGDCAAHYFGMVTILYAMKAERGEV